MPILYGRKLFVGRELYGQGKISDRTFKSKIAAESARRRDHEARLHARRHQRVDVRRNQNQGIWSANEDHTPRDGLGIGGAVGGAVGAAVAAIVAVGTTLFLPGINLVIAGPIAAASCWRWERSGAAGGLIGALIGAGIPEYRAEVYDAELRGGGIFDRSRGSKMTKGGDRLERTAG